MRGKQFSAKAREVRAVTYAPNGQRCETWLPAGRWQCEGECSIARDRDSVELVPALILFRPVPLKHEGVWYVAPSVVLS
jgi:hypothetical protein